MRLSNFKGTCLPLATVQQLQLQHFHSHKFCDSQQLIKRTQPVEKPLEKPPEKPLRMRVSSYSTSSQVASGNINFFCLYSITAQQQLPEDTDKIKVR
ncbi:hypothetical protein ACLKA7_002321 [Drosophila subpalustris]